MRHKSESFEKFKEFKNEVENQLDKKTKVLRSDRGGEYLSYEFGTYLKNMKLFHNSLHLEQLNGMVFRKKKSNFVRHGSTNDEQK
jgi:hypothetical protein